MRLHFAPGRTVLLGTILVLTLVALQPVALGCFPVIAGGEAGIGTGTGDLTAGALSALVRDINAEGAVPVHARSVSAVVLLLLADRDSESPRGVRARAVPIELPATALAGSSAHGYQLLL